MLNIELGPAFVAMGMLLTGAVSYGALRRRVENAERNVEIHQAKIDQAVSTKTCADHHVILENSLRDLARRVRGIENYVRWRMAKDGVDPDVIADTLGGRRGD